MACGARSGLKFTTSFLNLLIYTQAKWPVEPVRGGKEILHFVQDDRPSDERASGGRSGWKSRWCAQTGMSETCASGPSIVGCHRVARHFFVAMAIEGDGGNAFSIRKTMRH